MELADYRQEIDQLDRQILELFRRRMEVTHAVGQYKKEHGMPVLDQDRERSLIKKRGELAGPELQQSAVKLFETILALSRRQQRDLIGERSDNPGPQRFRQSLANKREPIQYPRVVYQGVPGAYSEQASLNFFGEDAAATGLEQFEDCFEALVKGEADYAVLPIENSSTGAIRQIYDLLSHYECYIVGETTVRVEHCLMALPGATLDTITHVYSHEQGLFQSERYLNTHPNWIQVPQADTAGSAQMVAASGDITKAAICAARAADIYGLKILASAINYNSMNTTRFVVVSPRMELRPGADKISTVFVIPDEVGSLHEILSTFAVHGLNMVKLESRPMPERNWEYMFFLEFTGDLLNPDTKDALHELAQTTADFRVLGNFHSNLS